MRAPVGDVVELVRPYRAAGFALSQLGGQAPGYLHVVVWIGVGHRRHFDEGCAGDAQRVFLFLALRFRDDDDGAIAECVADEREADAGVARRAFDDYAAWAQRAALDGVAHDEQRGAVLDRLSRIHEFGLAEDFATGLVGRALQADERRVAYGINDRFQDLHLGSRISSGEGAAAPVVRKLTFRSLPFKAW